MKLFKILIIYCLLFFANYSAEAQLGINDSNQPPANNAMLDISSTTKGLLIPRMTTTQRNALVTSDGLTVYDTNTKGYWYFNGTSWQNLTTVAGNTPWLTAGNNINNANTGNVGIGVTNPTEKLHVGPSAKIDNYLYVGDTGFFGSGNSFNATKVGAGGISIPVATNSGPKAMIFDWGYNNIKAGISYKPTNNVYASDLFFHVWDNTSSLIFGRDDPIGYGGQYFAEWMRLKNGNLGIGTNTPDTKLHVAGNIKMVDGNQAAGKVLTSDANGLASWQTGAIGWAANNNDIYNTNTGNVGIGTNSPISYINTAKTLSVHSSANSYSQGSNIVLSYDSQGTNYGNIGNLIFAQSNAGTTAEKKIATISTHLDTNGGYGSLANPKGHMDFYTNNGTGMNMAMTMSSQGKVGIGSFSIPPAFPLTFTSTLGDKIALYGNGGNHYGFGIQGNLLQVHSDAANSDVAFGYGSSGSFSETMRIKGNGNVGIGRSDPHVPLAFGNPFQKIAISLYKGPLGDVGLGVWGNELRLQCDGPSGKVAFGDLDANGNYFELAKASNDNQKFTVNGYINVGGTIYSSDERFKKNIKKLDSSLNKIVQLSGYEYDFKDDEFKAHNFGKSHQIGLIAQQVEKIVPEAVQEIAEGYKGVDYARLVPLLIEAIKEQQSQITSQQNQIDELKKVLSAK